MNYGALCLRFSLRLQITKKCAYSYVDQRKKLKVFVILCLKEMVLGYSGQM